jgi:hypothetical protein
MVANPRKEDEATSFHPAHEMLPHKVAVVNLSVSSGERL